MRTQVQEHISYHKPVDFPGVEVLRAVDSPRMWNWYHTAYSVCTPLRFRGSAEYVYRGRLHQAGPEHQLVMEPGEVHSCKKLTAPVTFRVLFLSERLLSDAAGAIGFGRVPVHFGNEPLAHPGLFQSFRRLHACLESNASTTLERESRLTEAIGRLLRVASSSRKAAHPSRASHQQMRQTADYLRANVVRSVSLDDLTRVSGLSRFHLVRQFTRVFGLPPHAYQLLLRVGRARELLLRGSKVDQAARQVGFVDASHLGRVFKRLTGVTPGAYSGAIGGRVVLDGSGISRSH